MRRLIITATLTALLTSLVLATTASRPAPLDADTADAKPPIAELFVDRAAEPADEREVATSIDDSVPLEQLVPPLRADRGVSGDGPSQPSSATAASGGATSEPSDAQADHEGHDGSPAAPPPLPEPGEQFEEEGDEEIGELEPAPISAGGLPEGLGFKSPWSGQVTEGLQGAQDLKAGRGCSANCITRGVAIGRGTGAELVVETDTPARLWIVVWRDGSYHQMRYAGDQRRTSFSSLFDDLEPGTTYQAAAFAQDAEGFQSEAYGTFTTRRRHVRVELGATNITGTPWAAKAYSVYPRIDHEWLPQFSAHVTEPYHAPMGGAQVVTLSDVGTHLDIATQVVATKAKADICEGWDLPSDTIPFNTAGCFAWATAPDGITAGVALDGAPDGVAYPVAREFWTLLSGNNGEGLHFTTSVTVKVWYA